MVFIIKKAIEEEFRQQIREQIPVEYVYQELDKLPEGIEVPEGREKPWGTGHAILCCKEVIHGPFAVINADDFYGRSAYEKIFHFICEKQESPRQRYAMVGYKLYNTLTENGHVARGVCAIDQEGSLKEITEHTCIEKHKDTAEYTEDGGKTWNPLGENTVVSMNL